MEPPAAILNLLEQPRTWLMLATLATVALLVQLAWAGRRPTILRQMSSSTALLLLTTTALWATLHGLLRLDPDADDPIGFWRALAIGMTCGSVVTLLTALLAQQWDRWAQREQTRHPTRPNMPPTPAPERCVPPVSSNLANFRK